MRKIIIGLIAVGFVASLFLAYALIMDAEPIEVRNTAGSDNPGMPESNASLQQARYVVLDPKTKETSRVFGCDRLLNPGMDTSRREVEKPYMIFYESDYQCRIDADTGMFQVETSGANSTPKDARLTGNVKIHITPNPGSKMSETLVEMDDLVFSSERSEFATDRKVHIQSEQVELKGTGLIVIFDSVSGRIDFLRIRDLEEIRMQGLTDPKPEKKVVKAPHAAGLMTPTSVPPQTDNPVASSERDAGDETKLPEPRLYYQCLLEDNVKIKKGNEIVVAAADQVNIQNISFDQGDGDDRAPEQAKDKTKEAPKSSEPSGQKVVMAAKPSEPSDQKPEPVQKIESSSEVVVTCDGGIILKPMQGEDADSVSQSEFPAEMLPMPLRSAKIALDSRQAPTIQTVNFVGEEDGVAKSVTAVGADTTDNTALVALSDPNNSPPAKFEARKIDYDLLTGSGLAHGPVRFTFYQDPDPNSTAPKCWIPITVTADENARFVADSSQTIKQVVFNGNVMTIRESTMPNFVQSDKIHSEKLTVDLDEIQTGSVDLSRLSVTEGRVYVDSQRTKVDQELSRVNLYCTKISYDKAHDVILAQGPGEIEMVNNERSQTAGSDSKNPMSQPCVAVVDSFTTIRWDMAKQSIVADGDQDAMKLAYYPIMDGHIQKQMFVYSMRLELSYLPDGGGIKRVFTDKSIIYEEWNSDMTKRLHYIVGQTLDYDVSDEGGWMKISGTPDVPCNVDGMRMQEVLVNPVTGEIDTSISKRPGFWNRH
jgi:hypothetical protein